MFGHFSADRQMDRQTDGQTFGHFSANVDRQTDGQMFGHFSANRQMDRQTDGQTEFANFNIDSVNLLAPSVFTPSPLHCTMVKEVPQKSDICLHNFWS